jgi:hypothetical protein
LGTHWWHLLSLPPSTFYPGTAKDLGVGVDGGSDCSSSFVLSGTTLTVSIIFASVIGTIVLLEIAGIIFAIYRKPTSAPPLAASHASPPSHYALQNKALTSPPV